jgi:hypothetical protein
VIAVWAAVTGFTELFLAFGHGEATVFGFFSIFYGVMVFTRATQRPPAA